MVTVLAALLSQDATPDVLEEAVLAENSGPVCALPGVGAKAPSSAHIINCAAVRPLSVSRRSFVHWYNTETFNADSQLRPRLQQQGRS